jgi:hypothetical protein
VSRVTQDEARPQPHGVSPNWATIRRRREIEGKNWSELARLHGVSRNRITRKALREGWRQPGEIVQKATEDFARRLVAREGDAVLDNLRRTLALTDRIRRLVETILDRLEGLGSEVDAEELKCAVEIVRKAHGIDADIAGISGRDQGWRPVSQDTSEATRQRSERISKILDELEGM